MFRLGLGQEVRATPTPREGLPLGDQLSPGRPLLPSVELDEYMQTSCAHMPTVVVLRLMGLLPSCLRLPVALQIGVEKEISGCCHKTGHVLLWIYSAFVWVIFLVTGLWSLAFVIGSTESEVQAPVIYWMLFDLFGLWQTIFLTGATMLKSSTVGWLMSSFDFFAMSFSGVFLTRNDLPVEAVLLRQKQAGSEVGTNEGELSGGNPKRTASGNQIQPMFSIQQQMSEMDRDRSEDNRSELGKEEEVPEELEFFEVYIRKSRMWDFLIMILMLTVLLGVLVYIIYVRVTTYVVKNALPPVLYPHMLKWTLDKLQVNMAGNESFVTSVGLGLECLVTLYQLIPSVLFVMLLVSYSHLANEFNTRLRLARDHAFLDIDATITYHHRLKTLAKRMSKSFGAVVFLSVFGDLVIVGSASFLGFTRICKLKNGDGLCISYLARHLLIVMRLLVVLLTGASIQDKLNLSILHMDGYMCKSILNTERLKILGMISQSSTCCFSASGFFKVTKPFAMGILTLVVSYMAVMYRFG